MLVRCPIECQHPNAWRAGLRREEAFMAQVTSGAETWVPHTHRNHHAGGTIWLFGPDGPTNLTGVDPVTVPASIGSYELLFLAASGTTDGDVTYDPGVTS